MFRLIALQITLLFGMSSLAQVSIVPFTQSNLQIQQVMYEYDLVKHPSTQQWVINISDDSLKNLVQDKWRKKPHKSLIARKIFNEDFIELDTANFLLRINPIFNFQVGVDASDTSAQTYTTNTRGIMIEASIGNKFGFITSFWENQSFFPSYLSNYVNVSNVVPGQGRVKRFKKTGFDYARASSVLYFKPFNWLSLRAGHGKNFYGNGYRSLLQSDFAFNYPYLNIGFHLFNDKLLYQPSFSSLQNLQRLPATNATEAQFVRKAGTTHILNFNLNNRIEVGLFEGGVWQNWDTNGTEKLPVNYYIPLIGLNTIINSFQSRKYKSILGLNSRVSITKKLQAYNQLVVSSDSSNRFGGQLGIKWFDAFTVKNLYLQTEFNTVEEGLYKNSDSDINYNHYNEGIGNYTIDAIEEFVFRSQYSIRDVFFRAKYQYQKGWTPTEKSLGNVTVSTNISHRVKTTTLEVGYMLNQANHMMILVGVQNRVDNAVLGTPNTQWMYISFRTELQNLYFDF